VDDYGLNLVKAAIGGDEKAFEELIILYYPLLHRIVACKIGRWEDREDVIQEILLILWLKLKDLRKPESFKAWLISVTNNRCREWYARKNCKEIATEPGVLTGIMDRQLPNRSYPDSYENLRETLAVVLENLPAGQKETIRDFYYSKLKIREIALIRGIPPGTVKRRLHEGRKSIKRNMEEKNG
jgi:RNA polymerase sigma-70 factor (ECF subfamily)